MLFVFVYNHSYIRLVIKYIISINLLEFASQLPDKRINRKKRHPSDRLHRYDSCHGCQRGIASTIVRAGADYILAVKNNQQELYRSIEDTFRFKSSRDIGVYKDLNSDTVELKTTLAMLKQYPAKRSIATKRKSAGWNNKVLMDTLTI